VTTVDPAAAGRVSEGEGSTAGMASWFVHDEREHTDPEIVAMRADVAEMKRTLRELVDRGR
jgi:hypothetical protein